VLTAAAVISLTGFSRADLLLEAAPNDLDLDEVRRHVRGVDHVLDVHDPHAYTVTSGLPVLTAHVVVDDECFRSGHAPQMLDAVQACLAGHFEVEHSTIQLEPAGYADHEHPAHA
jgi:cobalt-zinc-cadmium efflux system protein